MSSLPRSRSNGTPSLNEQERWSDDDMVTQQLSAESAVSQLLLYPLSTSSVATGMTNTGGSCTSSATSPTEAKTPLDSDGAAATGTLNGFDIGGFLHVEDLTNIDTDTTGLFSLSAATTSPNDDDGNDNNVSSNLTAAKSPRPSPIVLAPKSQSIETDCTSPTHSDSTIKTASPTSIDSPPTPQLDGTDISRRRPNGGRKRKAESLEEKEARARERILRNRHAAQMSRDKKRRQLIELEAQNAALIEQNALLREENVQMTKRVKLIEEDNSALSAKFEAISAQLSEIQSTLAISEVTKFLFDGARGSAVSAALEHSALATTANDDGKQRRERVARSTRSSLPNSCSLSTSSTTVFIRRRQERSRKSQQRPVKMRNLYGTPIQQSFRNWSRPQRLLMQLFLSLSIAFSTTTGQPTYLWFPSNSSKTSNSRNGHRKASVNDVVISVLRQRFNERCRLRSVKAKRGYAANIRLVPRDWRKYPP